MVGGLAYELTGHRGLAGEARARRQALRLRAGAARVPRAAAGRPGPAALGLRPAGAGRRALHAEPALPDDLLPAGRGRALDALAGLLRPGPARRNPLAGGARLALGAVLLGVGVSAIQVLPFLSLHPVLAAGRGRAERWLGVRRRFSLPPEEIVSTVLPAVQRDAGALLGPQLLQAAHRVPRARSSWCSRCSASATGARGGWSRRWASSASSSCWCVRRPHAVLPALVRRDADDEEGSRARAWRSSSWRCRSAVFAGFGADRLLAGEVSPRALLVPARRARRGWRCWGCVGVLESVADGPRFPEQAPRVVATRARSEWARSGCSSSWLLGGACSGRVLARAGCAASPPRRRSRSSSWRISGVWTAFFDFREPASVLFADDADHHAAPKGAESVPGVGRRRLSGAPYLMAHRIQTMLGYHGNEIRFYDELLGGKNQWRNAGSPNLHDLLGGAVPAAARAAGGARISPGRWAR